MFIKNFFFTLIMFLPYTAQAAGAKVKLPNPLEAESIPGLIGQMVNGLLGISGAIALFMLVWGGIQWMLSGGNADRLKKGKDAIVWAMLGLVVIAMSYIMVNFVFSLIGEST